ncbi:hypothetical protein BH24GEM1_BH24GEM1_13390 [soil metagenome]
MGWERRWRLALTLVLAVYGWECIRTPGRYRLLDSLDLAIHETGHLVFGFDGEPPMLLGGTLLQLLIPAAFTVAFWRQGDRHGATVPLWWLGQNCWNISVYIKDARAQELPLVGGGEHDWALLLGEMGWLDRDQRAWRGGLPHGGGALRRGHRHRVESPLRPRCVRRARRRERAVTQRGLRKGISWVRPSTIAG